ncbi:hypothetical protein [Amycolatopsis kentuckyensis]|uniref:hypothetical protein n=1 Tax=Amycolatopsis kentuckyensis TaxID=218823 RepID=UPI001ABF284B|nr:hypothetical protein [Amycolatopsis kentuckyensis]
MRPESKAEKRTQRVAAIRREIEATELKSNRTLRNLELFDKPDADNAENGTSTVAMLVLSRPSADNICMRDCVRWPENIHHGGALHLPP